MSLPTNPCSFVSKDVLLLPSPLLLLLFSLLFFFFKPEISAIFN